MEHEKKPHTPGPAGPSPTQPPSEQRLKEVNEQLTMSALHAQECAEESADRYRALVEGLDAIVWEAQADPWQFTFVSQRAQAMLGYPVSRWLTEPTLWTNLMHPDDRIETVNRWKAAVAARRDFRLEYRAIASDGGTVFLAMIGRFRPAAHAPAQFRGMLLDVGDAIQTDTLKKLVTQQTDQLLAQQITLSEHRQRTKLATELHDHLGQMLVLGRLKLGQAKRALGVVPEFAELIRQMEDVLDEALTYTRTLIADLRPPVLLEFGLLAGLRWLAEWMQRYDLRVEIEAPDSPILHVPEDHAVLLFQSVRELLINVTKYAETNQARMSIRCQNAILGIDVRDEGRGFDSSAVTVAAAPANVSAPPSSQFGLFAIRERMKAMGGTFEIHSAPGKGTTARLMLPVSTTAELQDRGAVSGGQPTDSRSSDPSSERPRLAQDRPPIRVLLVDDHAMVRQGLRSIVDAYAHLQVAGEANNGVKAIDAVRELRPDVVVMDLNMPQMNGIEATKRIKQEFPDTAVIGLSVNPESTELAQTLKDAGFCQYLTKESAVDALCHAIEEAVSPRPYMAARQI
jgi:signal transduction histidine kinase/CheY-like chemotaxis protein